jgi:hypothetical protein
MYWQFSIWQNKSLIDRSMDAQAFWWIDRVVFLAANLINLLLAAMFLYRARGLPATGSKSGWLAVACGVPLAIAAGLNLFAARDWPYWVLPLVTVLYCLIELLLDGILKIQFRQSRMLGPYLASYYIGLMAMIGYTFLAGKTLGFITLVTYFINLGATGYSFSRVRHA